MISMQQKMWALGLSALVMAAAVSAAPNDAPASAAPAGQATTEVAAAVYTLDPAHTQIGFTINRFGFNEVIGRFDVVSGELAFDPAAPERSHVEATVQMASVSTGNAQRDQHLRGAHWLNAEAMPTMTFRSTAVRVIDRSHFEVVGELTLLGVSAPLSLDVTLNRLGTEPSGKREAVGFSATGVVSRAQFGLRTAAQLIGDEVRVTIQALALAPAPATP